MTEEAQITGDVGQAPDAAPTIPAGNDAGAAEIAALEAQLRGRESRASAGAPTDDGAATGQQDQQAEDEPAEDRPRDNQGRFVKQVPLTELQAERKKRQELESRLSEVLDLMSRQQTAPKQQTPAEQDKPKSALEEPDIDVMADPLAAMEQLRRRNAELLGMVRQDQQGRQIERAATTLEKAVQSDAAAFARETPDFPAAAQFLLDGVRAELEMNGITDRDQQAQMIRETEERIATTAIRGGRSPAQAFYDLAKIRGYRPGASPAPKPGGKTENPTPAQQVAAMRQMQEGATSLSVAGGSGREDLTVNRALAMTETDFAEFAEAHGGMAFIDRLLGKR